MTCEAAETLSFWPKVLSIPEESSYTAPGLVLQAEDGQPLTIGVDVNSGTTAKKSR